MSNHREKSCLSRLLLTGLLALAVQPRFAAAAAQDAPAAGKKVEEKPAFMRARSTFFGRFGSGITSSGFVDDSLSTFAGWSVMGGGTAEFPVHRLVVVGAQAAGGVDSLAGFLDAGFLMRLRFFFNERIAWQMPFRLGVGYAFDVGAPPGFSAGISLVGLESFVTDRLAILFDVAELNFFLDMYSLTFANIGIAYVWR